MLMPNKVIKSVDDSSVNVITIHFTDGSYSMLESVMVNSSIGLTGIEIHNYDDKGEVISRTCGGELF